MPYIITTYQPDGFPDHAMPDLLPANRTAVATLDEARDAAHKTIHAAYRTAYPLKPRGLGGEHSDAQRAHRWHNVDVKKLTDAGGTIGPLPDGTVIEVREWTADDSYALSQDVADRGDIFEMVAAFNAHA